MLRGHWLIRPLHLRFHEISLLNCSSTTMKLLNDLCKFDRIVIEANISLSFFFLDTTFIVLFLNLKRNRRTFFQPVARH